jgi:hypothetical protein
MSIGLPWVGGAAPGSGTTYAMNTNVMAAHTLPMTGIATDMRRMI